MKKILLIILSLCLPSGAFSQNLEGALWYFGEGAGLDFREGKPKVDTSGKHFTPGPTSTICDSLGNLIFYSTDRKIFNKNHDTLATPVHLTSSFFGINSVMTLKIPATKDFYLFRTHNAYSSNNTKIDYLKIKNGDLISEYKVLNSHSPQNPTSYFMAPLQHANNKDYWLLTNDSLGKSLLAYLIDSTGIHEDPVTNEGDFSSFDKMKASPNSKLVVMYGLDGDAAVYRFNRSNASVEYLFSEKYEGEYQLFKHVFDASFSPDNSKLYINRFGEVLQYDLNKGDTAAIKASKTVIHSDSGTWFSAIQMAVDGKMYVARSQINNFVDVIHCPDLPGNACGYQDSVIDLLGRSGGYGLPNLNQTLFVNASQFRIIPGPELNVCTGDTLWLTAAGAGCDRFRWTPSTGLTCDTCARVGILPGTGTGEYQVVGYKFCGDTDTARVKVYMYPRINLPGRNDTVFICEGDTLLASRFGGSVLKSFSGSNQFSADYLIPAAGEYRYFLEVSNPGCRGSDSVYVKVHPTPAPVVVPWQEFMCQDFDMRQVYTNTRPTEGSTSVWKAEGGTLVSETSTGVEIYWDQTPQKMLSLQEISDKGCTGTHTLKAIYTDSLTQFHWPRQECPPLVPVPQIPNVITPNGDGVNDRWVIGNTELYTIEAAVYNRWGLKIFETSDYQNSWPTQNVTPGVYFYRLRTPAPHKQEYKGWVEVR